MGDSDVSATQQPDAAEHDGGIDEVTLMVTIGTGKGAYAAQVWSD